MKINEMTFKDEINATDRVRKIMYCVRKLNLLLKDVNACYQTEKSFANNIDITNKDLDVELLEKYMDYVTEAVINLIRAEVIRWGLHEGSDK